MMMLDPKIFTCTKSTIISVLRPIHDCRRKKQKYHAYSQQVSLQWVEIIQHHFPDRFPHLDLIFIESGGDNLSATFRPELADLTIYVIDVTEGEKMLR